MGRLRQDPRGVALDGEPRRAQRASAGQGSGLPKHELVTTALAQDIRNGRYRVGEQLPSEPDLSVRFGVSRQTVRAALRTLREQGLVSSQQGIGTQVKATHPSIRYTQAFDSAEDLLQYASTTRVRLIDRTEVVIDAALAAQFGCKPGEHWWRLRTVRSDAQGHAVIAYSEIHIPLAFGAVLHEQADSGEPVFALIEQRFNERIEDIQQEIACVPALNPDECRHLRLPPDSPGMEITRRYYGRRGRLLEVARTVHPCGVYKYSMRVRLRHDIDAHA